MTTQAQDWRLQGQEQYLQGVLLKKASWSCTRPGWDHDHCSFCGAKFGGAELAESLHEGYATLDEYHWICAQCYEDFREQFKWQLQR